MRKLPASVPVHPIANIFPVMSEVEFEALKKNIYENDQNEPCVFWEEQLIDGRHRYLACMELGIEPDVSELMAETDPIAYALSANLHRRHLSTTQRAMIGAKLSTLKNGSNQHAKKNVAETAGKEGAHLCAPSSEDTAKLLNIGLRSIVNAKQVLATKSKPLIEAVETGKVPVTLAAKLANECDDKASLTELVKGGSKAIREFLAPPETEALPEKEEAELCDVVEVFEKSKSRLNDLKQIVATLSETEKAVLLEWLAT